MEGIKTKGVINGLVAGKSFIQCSKCHTFLLVDYDKMTAEPTLREKEVYKMVVNE